MPSFFGGEGMCILLPRHAPQEHPELYDAFNDAVLLTDVVCRCPRYERNIPDIAQLQMQQETLYTDSTTFAAHGGSYPAGGYGREDEDLSGAAEHASRHAGDSGDSSLFSSILGSLGEKRGRVAQEDVDEEGKPQQHEWNCRRYAMLRHLLRVVHGTISEHVWANSGYDRCRPAAQALLQQRWRRRGR